MGKKQHYVARTYLKNFCINTAKKNKEIIFVWDKKKRISKQVPTMSIVYKDYLYDINWEDDYLRELFIDKSNAELEQMNTQVIENGFDNILESKFSSKVEELKKEIKEFQLEKKLPLQYTISDKLREFFSVYIVHQIIRTPRFLDSVLSDMGTKTYDFAESHLKNKEESFQGNIRDDIKMWRELGVNKDFRNLTLLRFLMNEKFISKFSTQYFNYYWVIGVNKTGRPFITSDTPVLSIGHNPYNKNDFHGWANEGIEILFPLTPEIIIRLYEPVFFQRYKTLDGKIVELKPDNIQYCNYFQMEMSQRFVFSNKDFRSN